MKVVLDNGDQTKLLNYINCVRDTTDKVYLHIQDKLDRVEDKIIDIDIYDNVERTCGCYNKDMKCCEVSWEECRCDNTHECNGGKVIPIILNGQFSFKPII